MTDSPALFDRIRALKDAEAALVDARLTRDEQLADPRTTLTRVLPYRPTDVEIVVDAVLISVARTPGLFLTAEEAALAAEAVRTSVGWDRFGDEPARRRALAERLEAVS